jgi:predicted alpha/beta-fold hydrolase
MPIVKSNYRPGFPFQNGHLNTIHKTLFYHISCSYKRERIDTPDGDFLDLDFAEIPSNTLVMVLHGLEGSSRSKYIQSLIRVLNSNCMAAVAFNARGCSGEVNNKYYSYHSGKTDDVSTALNYLTATRNYENILLAGFSMGGNMVLKYLGERHDHHHSLKGGIGISVPCDLGGSSDALTKAINRVYLLSFMQTLKQKARNSLKRFPDSPIDLSGLDKAHNFEGFDNAVTARLFNYNDARDYWEQNSSLKVLNGIKIPTLLINAKDDSFLSKSCYPYEIAKKHEYLWLETPDNGGHVGFNSGLFRKKRFWLEQRVVAFIRSNILI